jgi:hypothetical protein
MAVDRVRKEFLRARAGSRRNQRIHRSEVQRLSDMVAKREDKLADARRKLAAAQEREAHQ